MGAIVHAIDRNIRISVERGALCAEARTCTVQHPVPELDVSDTRNIGKGALGVRNYLTLAHIDLGRKNQTIRMYGDGMRGMAAADVDI